MEDQNAGEMATLRTGLQVYVRPIRPNDAPRLQTLVANLSPQSVYLRTMLPLRALSDEDARRLATVNYTTRMAYAATLGPAEAEEIVGVARYAVIDPTEQRDGATPEASVVKVADGEDATPVQAEVAVVVLDAYQSQGLGALLLARLVAYARRQGISIFVATILPQNDVVRRLIRRIDLPVEYRSLGPGEIEVLISLEPGATAEGSEEPS